MAWNPSPEVAKARKLATELGADQIIILAINGQDGSLKSFKWGFESPPAYPTQQAHFPRFCKAFQRSSGYTVATKIGQF